MKRYLLFIILLITCSLLKAQVVDSICFHLYTDSLKKGQHNYINVDGRLSNGRWQPMTSKELIFTTTDGEFIGNEIIIPENFTTDKIKVKAVLRSNPSISIEKTIWIKTIPDPELPAPGKMKRTKNNKPGN